MPSSKLFTALFAVSLAVLSGCKNKPIPSLDINHQTNRTNQNSNVCAVIVGVENSAYAGSCPGARLDSRRMSNLVREFATDTTLIQDSGATRQCVTDAIRKAIQKAGEGLFIFYYSGHGGSNPFPDTGLEETDGKDEYLCLYDTYLRDNEIWKLISQSKARVFCIFDCCHSRTCFRSPSFTFLQSVPLASTWVEDGPISMQFWAGCPDFDYSYGSDWGGKFTNAILSSYKKGISYDALWNAVESNASLRKYETVQRTIMGKEFGSLPFLK